MDASAQLQRLRKSISGSGRNATQQRSLLYRLHIRSRINDGTFLCRQRSNLEFSSAHVNGTYRRGTISRLFWSRGNYAKTQAKRSQLLTWMATEEGDY